MDYHEISQAQDINYRQSGLLLAGIMAAIYLGLIFKGKNHPVALIIAIAMAACAWYELAPLRKAVALLIQLGAIMNRITNPVVLALVYGVAVAPTALVLKLLGKKVLCLGYDRNCSTYWIPRTNGTTWGKTFKNQF